MAKEKVAGAPAPESNQQGQAGGQQPQQDPKPSTGRIVHYRHRNVADDHTTERVLPAIVLDAVGDVVTLKVFREGHDLDRHGVQKSDDNPFCWFWPPKV